MPGPRARHIIRAVSVSVAATVIGLAVAQGMTAQGITVRGHVVTAGTAQATVARNAAPRVPTPDQVKQSTAKELFAGGLAVQPDSIAAQQVALLTKQGKTTEASAIRQIASQPVAVWLGDWFTQAQLTKVVNAALANAAASSRTATFVTYAIPDRDCGGYSSGGLTAKTYLAWNQTIANALKGHRAAVLVEPDSLAMISNCPDVASARLPLVKSAVSALASAGVATYLDAGNSHWVDPATMASRLNAAGIAQARGFFTNVANYYPLTDETTYADKVSALTGGSHYVVDVSRNGQGWKGTWCNPTGAGLGANPVVATGRTKLDATLWVKTPGASDGTCNGGPTAGTWWQSYALALVKLRAR